MYNYGQVDDWIEATELARTDTFITPAAEEGKPAAPTGLVAVQSSSTSIDLSWTVGALAVTTVVVRRINSAPVNPTDGVVVYNNTGNSFTDTSLSFLADDRYFYRAWSLSEWGYSDDYAEDVVGGTNMFLIALALMAIALTGTGYWTRRPAIGFGAAGMWLILGLYSYTLTAGAWDIYYGLFWIGIALTIVVALESFVLRPKRSEEEVEEKVGWDEFGKRLENYRSRTNRIRRVGHGSDGQT